jgi:hypothetical protein
MFIITRNVTACFGYILANLKPTADKFKSSNGSNLT